MDKNKKSELSFSKMIKVCFILSQLLIFSLLTWPADAPVPSYVSVKPHELTLVHCRNIYYLIEHYTLIKG